MPRRGKKSMIRNLKSLAALPVLISMLALTDFSQSNSALHSFFSDNVGLSQDQISAIRSGKPVTKTFPARDPSEVFLFGAIYIHATPEAYVKFARDDDRLRKLPNYLALGE